MASSIIVVPPAMFAASAASSIADLIRTTIGLRGECSLALCGGTTPAAVFDDLVGRTVRWSQVTIFFSDERAVPPDHPESNFDLARRRLLDHVPVQRHNIHRMQAERPDRDAAAREYERLMPPTLDILLLGIGLDGHTASLFPGSSALAESPRRVLAVPSPPLPIRPQVDRMTITPSVIAEAQHIVVLVAGAEKAGILARVLDGPDRPDELPAQLARHGSWIVDEPAAAHLRHRDY